MSLPRQCCIDLLPEDLLQPGVLGGRLSVRCILKSERDVVGEIDAVGDVKIEVELWVERRNEHKHRLHRGRVSLDIVAVKIDVLRSGPPALFDRATLVRGAESGGIFVPLDVNKRPAKEI